MRNNRDYFFCYSPKVSRFLKSQGVYFITVAKDMNTDRVFSLYEVTPQLQEVLKLYKQSKDK